jgi:hypothetical protein
MADEDVSTRVAEAERRFWTAMQRKDGAAAASLVTEHSQIVGTQGLGDIDRQTLMKMVENAPYHLLDYDMADMRVRQVGAGVAIATYKVTEKLVVEGRDLTLEAFDSSVWVREGDQWLCALHTESPAGDPFGRK